MISAASLIRGLLGSQRSYRGAHDHAALQYRSKRVFLAKNSGKIDKRSPKKKTGRQINDLGTRPKFAFGSLSDLRRRAAVTRVMTRFL
jgi:hypothetical protein